MTDEKILELINEVNKRKAEIKRLEKPNWKTNCSFSWSDEEVKKPVNIHVVNDINTIIGIAGFLIEMNSRHDSGKQALGIKDGPIFKWGGYLVEDWLYDLELRLNKIQINDKKRSLENLEKRLEKLISPELRAKMEIELIEKELSIV